MVGLLALALVLRVAVAVAVDGDPLIWDAADYHRHGVSIAHGQGYPSSILVPGDQPSAFRAPAYPYFLGAVYAARSDSVRAARVVQVLLGVLAVALLGWIATRLFGPRAGVATLALGAVYPPLVMASAPIMSEALFLPVAAAVAAASVWLADRPGDWRRLALVGALVGVATLTRTPGVVLGLVPALVLLRSGDASSLALRAGRIAVVAGVALLCIAPWTVRNAFAVDHFVPVSEQTGFQLSGLMNDRSRTNPDMPGLWALPTRRLEEYRDIFARRDLDEIEFNDALKDRAVEYLKDHPTYLGTLIFWHSVRMLHFGPRHLERTAAREFNVPYGVYVAGRWAFYALALLAIAGIVVVRRIPLWLWLTPLALFAAGAVGAGLIRYRLPADLFMVVLAGPALLRLRGGGRREEGV